MTFPGVLLIRPGPLKKDEELDEVLEKYGDQGSIVVKIRRLGGVSSLGRSTKGGRGKSPENVPEKVVKKTGCYTKTRSDTYIGFPPHTY